MVGFCLVPIVPGEPCGRGKLRLPTGAMSTMCYWHRLARCSIDVQIRKATQRAQMARERPGHVERARTPAVEWPAGERWCAGCQGYVPLWYCTGSRCRACAASSRSVARDRDVYGADADTISRLEKIQDGRCAICRKRQLDRKLARDHDHKTGTLRGLLCHRCNHDLLGAAYDSVNILRAAVRYLETPPAAGDWTPPESSDDELSE